MCTIMCQCNSRTCAVARLIRRSEKSSRPPTASSQSNDATASAAVVHTVSTVYEKLCCCRETAQRSTQAVVMNDIIQTRIDLTQFPDGVEHRMASLRQLSFLSEFVHCWTRQ